MLLPKDTAFLAQLKLMITPKKPPEEPQSKIYHGTIYSPSNSICEVVLDRGTMISEGIQVQSYSAVLQIILKGYQTGPMMRKQVVESKVRPQRFTLEDEISIEGHEYRTTEESGSEIRVVNKVQEKQSNVTMKDEKIECAEEIAELAQISHYSQIKLRNILGKLSKKKNLLKNYKIFEHFAEIHESFDVQITKLKKLEEETFKILNLYERKVNEPEHEMEPIELADERMNENNNDRLQNE